MLQKRTGRKVRGVSPGAGRESMVGKTCERGRCWMWFIDSDDVIGQGWIQDLLVWAIVIGWSYKQEGTCRVWRILPRKFLKFSLEMRQWWAGGDPSSWISSFVLITGNSLCNRL